MHIFLFVEVISAPSPHYTHNWIDDIESAFFNENKGSFYFEKHGVTVIFPDGGIESGVQAELTCGASIFAPVKFPKNLLPVSSIIRLYTNVTLQKPVQIQLQHYLNIKSKAQLNNLHFAKAVHSQNDISMMEVISGGKFAVGESHGSIEVDHFCYLSVVYEHYGDNVPDSYKYQAILFQNNKLREDTWKFDICVLPALSVFVKVSFYFYCKCSACKADYNLLSLIMCFPIC